MEFNNNEILYAFTLTLFAGGATAIGSIIAFFAKSNNKRFLSISLGFSAGVMVFVSFVDIFPKSIDAFTPSYGENLAQIYTMISFFTGILFIAVIDLLIPEAENPHELKNINEAATNKSLMRMGLFSALAIAIHNLPEGLATFTAALIDPEIAIPIAIAIAIHNIPEGIAISVPIYHATKSKRKAFIYSALSGLAEPVGAILGFALLTSIVGLSESIMGAVFGGVAGVMVYISLDELLPSAAKYGNHHTSILGFIFGMLIMAISLIII